MSNRIDPRDILIALEVAIVAELLSRFLLS